MISTKPLILALVALAVAVAQTPTSGGPAQFSQALTAAQGANNALKQQLAASQALSNSLQLQLTAAQQAATAAQNTCSSIPQSWWDILNGIVSSGGTITGVASLQTPEERAEWIRFTGSDGPVGSYSVVPAR